MNRIARIVWLAIVALGVAAVVAQVVDAQRRIKRIDTELTQIDQDLDIIDEAIKSIGLTDEPRS